MIGVHDVLRQVADQHRNTLADSFLGTECRQILGFCRKSHTERSVFERGDFGQDVGVLDKVELRGLARLFFEFFR